jgi:hypothetical protein
MATKTKPVQKKPTAKPTKKAVKATKKAVKPTVKKAVKPTAKKAVKPTAKGMTKMVVDRMSLPKGGKVFVKAAKRPAAKQTAQKVKGNK